MKFLSNKIINPERRFEFDLAKAVCILGMVFVHCYEMFAFGTDIESSTTYYIIAIVLDAIFGAGTFMACMGLGIAYSLKSTPNKLIKRGLTIFATSYILNFLRAGIPTLLLYFGGYTIFKRVIISFLITDILGFAGLALMLFGVLKKLKLNDITILIISIVMSIIGSFIKTADFGPYWVNQLLGLFVGTIDEIYPEVTVAAFPLFNWFIIVVAGYFLGKFLQRCKNIEKYYAISLPSSALVLSTYMAIAIPNKIGMLSGDLVNFYQFTTFEALILIVATVFVSGIYYYISKLFSDKLKKIVTRLSSNINSVYCIHWIIISYIYFILLLVGIEGLNNYQIIIAAIVIYVVVNILAEVYQKLKSKTKNRKKTGS